MITDTILKEIVEKTKNQSVSIYLMKRLIPALVNEKVWVIHKVEMAGSMTDESLEKLAGRLFQIDRILQYLEDWIKEYITEDFEEKKEKE